MSFGYNIIDKTKDDHLRELAAIANSPDTLVFLDTNIVSYMYKLHAAARQEFFAWTDSVAAKDRLRIPAWCAGEYLARLRDGQLHSYTPKSKDEDQPRKALEAMLDTASLFVDESLLQAIQFAGDRTAYLTQFREAIDGLRKFTRAFKHQFDPEAVHEEIQQHLGGVILDSDLAELCGRAAKEGPARIEHRLPPAFRDEGKPENRLGDLIIWLEILESSRARKASFHNVLFVTNDEKSDWVYAPLRRMEIVNGRRKAVPNGDPKLRIIDPRLVSEFRRAVGHESISICSLLSLVEGFSKVHPGNIGQLAAAIQIDLGDSGSKLSGTENVETPVISKGANPAEDVAPPAEPQPAVPANEAQPLPEPQPEPQPEPAAEAAGEHLAFDEDGYRDAAYEADAPGEINEIIRALKSHNWYTQNPAVGRIKAIRTEPFPPTAWFVLGRNIYQAACGNAQKAMDFMVNLDIQLRRFPEEVGQYILCGIVFEIYFDSQGVLRSVAKSTYLDKSLSVVASTDFSGVRDFVRTKLLATDATLLFLPGDDRKFELRIVSEDLEEGAESSENDRTRRLGLVELDGVALLAEGQQDDLTYWGRSTLSYTADELVQEISSVLLIPRWAIRRKFEPSVPPNARFLLPEGRFLRPKLAAQPPA